MKPVFIAGLVVFGVVYALFGSTAAAPWLFVAFALYAVYAAATEGIAKAWISNLAGGNNTATAIGFYTSGQSICSLLASSFTGLVWTLAGSAAAFYLSAFLAMSVALWLLLALRKQ
jgi:MFS family permease